MRTGLNLRQRLDTQLVSYQLERHLKPLMTLIIETFTFHKYCYNFLFPTLRANSAANSLKKSKFKKKQKKKEIFIISHSFTKALTNYSPNFLIVMSHVIQSSPSSERFMDFKRQQKIKHELTLDSFIIHVAHCTPPLKFNRQLVTTIEPLLSQTHVFCHLDGTSGGKRGQSRT